MFRVTINIVRTEVSYWRDFGTQSLSDDYIQEMIATEHWGKNAYEIEIGMNDDVTPYSSTRIESKYLVHNLDDTTTETVVSGLPPEGTLPEDIIYEKKFGTIPAEVTFSTTDVTQEYNQKAFDAYTLDRVAQADSEVSTLLQGYDRTTITADSLANLIDYLNLDGSRTSDEIAASKALILNSVSTYKQAKQIQAQMYTDIAAKKAELGL